MFPFEHICSHLSLTISAFFDHQVNTPLVYNSAYPTTNSSYGLSFNLNLNLNLNLAR